MQDTNHYSENYLNVPFLIASNDSKRATTANDQHEPHDYWSLIGFTFPYALQSTDFEAGPSDGGVGSTGGLSGIIAPSKALVSSSIVMELNLFLPSANDPLFLLKSLIAAYLFKNISLRFL